MLIPFNRINCGCLNSEFWGKLTEKKKAEIREYDAFNMFFTYFSRLALERYTLEGLPLTCDERLSKQSLLWACTLSLIEMENGLISLGGRPSTDPSMYGYMHYGVAYDYAGEDYELGLYIPGTDVEPKEAPYKAFMIYENFDCVPFINVVYAFAEAAADTWLKMGVSRRNAATPYVIGGDSNSLTSIKKAINQRESNQDVVVVDFGFSIAKGTFFPLQDAMKGMNAFEEHLVFLINQFCTLCGIDSNPVARKKERVNSSEIEVAGMLSSMSIENTLESLNYYLGEVNRIRGTNIRAVRKEYENAAVQGLVADTGAGDMGDAGSGDTGAS